MPTIVISGAGSGIGHTFVDHYSNDSNNIIHAIDVTWSDEVSDSKGAAKITRHTVDSSSEESIDKLKKDLGDKPVDLFIHSAAIRGLNPEVQKKSDLPADAETLDVTIPEILKQTLLVNTLGSFMIIRALIPNLKAAKNSGRCIVMSSGMGSIANNQGGAYAYGSSKAGLNYIVKSFHHDVPEVLFAIIHPGKVDTRMTHVREEGAIDAEEAVEMMLPIMNGLKAGEELKFVTREGKDIPW